MHQALGCVLARDLEREVDGANVLALGVSDWQGHRGTGCLCAHELRPRTLRDRAPLLQAQRLAGLLLSKPAARA